MKGKFSTKTIVIIALTVLLLAIGVTGTVLFLKDSGEAAAMEEKNVLPVTGTDNEPESGAETPINQENQGENGGEQQTEETPNTTVNTTGETTSTRTTTPTQSTREITQEPETSTVEREKVIAESKELNWNKFSLTEDADNLNKNINYNNLKYKVEYYFDGELDESLTEIVGKNKKDQKIETYEDKVKAGYGLERTENLPLTVSEVEENNVIKVFYAKQEFKIEKVATLYKLENNKEEVKTRSAIIEKAEKGDKIHYLVTVTNTGKVDINGIRVSDTMQQSDAIVDVKVGETKTAFEYDYEVTQDDIDAQTPIYNKAVAKTDNNEKEIEVTVEVIEKVNYTINYYKDNVAEGNFLGKVEGTSELGSTITADVTMHIPEGYKFVGTAPSMEIITGENVINVVYVKDSFGYKVNYYKDSIAETNFLAKEEETAEFGSTVTADVTIHIPEGYKFEGIAPSTEITTGENVINVVYVKDDFGYKVNYYKDSIAETNFLAKEEGTAEFGSTVTADVTIHIPEGYKFVGTAPSTEITTGENVINVVYVKDSFGYRVYYYKDSVAEANFLAKEEGVAELGSTITADVTIHIPEGYKFVGTAPSTEIATGENVINVVYVKDSFGYRVNYYKDSIAEENFRGKVEGIAEFGSTVTADVTIHIPEGYKFEGTAPSKQITAGENIINVVYVKDSFGYRVNYYKDSIAEENFRGKVEGIAEFGSTVTADVTIHIPEGYKFEGTAPSKQITAGENIINVVYVKRTDLSCVIKYFYNNREVSRKETLKNKTLGEQITEAQIPQKAEYENEIYELKEYKTLQGNKKLPLTIQSNEALNVIEVYYVKPIISITKTSNAYKANTKELITDNKVHEGDEIEYTITISNRGSAEAKNLSIRDTIDLTKVEINKIVIDDKEQQIPQNGIIIWNGNVAEGEQQIITIRVKVKTLPESSNGAKIDKNKVYLNNDTQNPIEDQNEYTVLKTNIKTEKTSKAYTSNNTEIQKTETRTKLHVGDYIEYTIKVWNTGNEGTTVTIKDEAPDGTKYKSGELTKTVYVPANTEYKDAITMTFKVEVIQSGLGKVIKNTATVEETNGNKKEPKDPTEYKVVEPAKIILSKTSSVDKNNGTVPIVEYGDIIEYTITARNDGGEAGTAIIKDEDLKKAIDDKKVELKEIKTSGVTLKALTEDGISFTVEANSAKTIVFKVKVIANVNTEIINVATAAGTENEKTEPVKAKVEKTVDVTENKENTKITGSNIVLVLDNSDSMKWSTYVVTNKVCKDHSTSLGHGVGHCKQINGVWYKTEKRNRLELAKEVTNKFIDMIDLPETKTATSSAITVIKFNGESSVVGKANNAKEANELKNKVNSIRIENRTVMADALELAREELLKLKQANPNNANIVIFVSDGVPNDPDDVPAAASKLKAVPNTTVYAVAFEADIDILKNEIATPGKYYTTENVGSLSGIFQQIVKENEKPNKFTKQSENGQIELVNYDDSKNLIIKVNGKAISNPTQKIIKKEGKTYLDLTKFAASDKMSIEYYIK